MSPKKSIILLLAVIIAVILSLFLINNKGNASVFSKLGNSYNGKYVAVQYPKNWELREKSGDEIGISLYSKDSVSWKGKNYYSDALIVSSIQNQTNPQKMQADTMNSFSTLYENYKQLGIAYKNYPHFTAMVIYSEHNVFNNELPRKLREFPDLPVIPGKGMDLLTVAGGKFYWIGFVAPKEKYETMLPVIESMLKTLVLN